MMIIMETMSGVIKHRMLKKIKYVSSISETKVLVNAKFDSTIVGDGTKVNIEILNRNSEFLLCIRIFQTKLRNFYF